MYLKFGENLILIIKYTIHLLTNYVDTFVGRTCLVQLLDCSKICFALIYCGINGAPELNTSSNSI